MCADTKQCGGSYGSFWWAPDWRKSPGKFDVSVLISSPSYTAMQSRDLQSSFGFPTRVLSFGKEEVIKCYRCFLWQKPVMYRGERKGKACAMAFTSIALHVWMFHTQQLSWGFVLLWVADYSKAGNQRSRCVHYFGGNNWVVGYKKFPNVESTDVHSYNQLWFAINLDT